MSKKLKKRLIRIIIASSLFIPLFIVDKVLDLASVIPNTNVGWLLPLSLYLVIYVIIAYDILIKAAKNIAHGHVFDENFLMIIATFGAFAIMEFPEAVAVMLLYQIGEFFQDLAVGKSRKSIANLMDICPESANILHDDGTIETVDPELVEIGNIIRVEPGEKVPLDGVIISGVSSLDMKALTGESLPREVECGNDVISGSINLTSSIDIEVKKVYSDSAVSKILELVENSTNVKSKQENFISKFAKYYTPIVVISAVLLALIGSLVTHNYYDWIARALNFLVVSCPCAIVISVPLSFFTSIGKAAKLGILIKGSLYLENFNNAKTYVFDKTGTLTKGNFAVDKVLPIENKDEILRCASIAESQSNHPIALSITKYAGSNSDSSYSITNVAGKGLIATKGEEVIFAGNRKLLLDNDIDCPMVEDAGTIVFIAKNKTYLGYIVIKDEIKEDSVEVIDFLKKQGIKTVMLTGDVENVAKEVSERIGIDEYHHSLLPQDKVTLFEELMNNKKKNELITYVGDGINDAPTLARSDIGVAMGAIGSDAAIEASDIVLVDDKLSGLLLAKKIAKKTMLIVKENIIFALAVKAVILILSALGYASIWLAIFGDVGVALLCVLNAMRSGNIKK